jgi:MFS family permease
MTPRVSHLIAAWRTGLSRPVLILQVGNALNFFGYGLVLPFEIIYLHQVRGFSTSTAGLILAATMGASAFVTPPTGALLDRYSAKVLVVTGSLASALGYAGFAFVDRPWQGFACSIVSGAGLGAAGTANRTLLVRLISPEQRAAAFALNRVAGNFGIGSGATVAGFIVASAERLSTFQLLYFFDAVTYAGFALIVLAAVPSPRAEVTAATDANGTGFRAVARDRVFLVVIAANIVLVVVGHTLFSNILPPFAKAHTPVGPAGIGIIILVNTCFIVIAQIPAVAVVARMRRTHAFAVTSLLFAVGLLAVLPATFVHSELAATGVLAGVAIVLATGEIAHILVLGPLVADMAPAHLLGRYLSVYSLTFTGSLAIGPALGGLLLQTSPDAIWWGGALAAVLAGAVLLQLGDRIPDPREGRAFAADRPGQQVDGIRKPTGSGDRSPVRCRSSSRRTSRRRCRQVRAPRR